MSIAIAKRKSGKEIKVFSPLKKRREILHEAVCVLMPKLKTLLDICLTIQTMSTKFFFSMSGRFVAKQRSRLSDQLMLCVF